MSYNIDTFKVKKLENLKIPVSYLKEEKGWHQKKSTDEDGTTIFEDMESFVTGIVIDNILDVLEIVCRGEGSGRVMLTMLEPALKQSKGILIVSCVWEGGDSINRLIVKDGNVKWEDIEI